MYACIKSSEKCVVELLQAGADTDVTVPPQHPACAGWTALHFAVAFSCSSIVEVCFFCTS